MNSINSVYWHLKAAFGTDPAKDVSVDRWEERSLLMTFLPMFVMIT